MYDAYPHEPYNNKEPIIPKNGFTILKPNDINPTTKTYTTSNPPPLFSVHLTNVNISGQNIAQHIAKNPGPAAPPANKAPPPLLMNLP